MAKKRDSMSESAQEIYRHMNTYEFADGLFRKEYTQLRAMVNKRIQRAKASGYAENMGYFPKLKNIPNRQQFAKELSLLRDYAENPISTAAGRREREEDIINTLHDHGFENINRKNFKQFKDFMKAMEKKYKGETRDGKKKYYDSDKPAEFFDSLEMNKQKESTIDELSDMYEEWKRHH